MDNDFEEFTNGFNKGNLNKLLALIRKWRTLPVGPGWSQTPDGQVHDIRTSVVTALNNNRWTLEAVNTEAGSESVKIIRPGTVRYGGAIDGTNNFSITNIGSTIAVSENDYLVLEFTLSTRVLELKALSTWDAFPNPFNIDLDVSTGEPSLTSAVFPLWKIAASDESTDRNVVTIGSDLKGIRMVADADFQMRETLHETSAGLVVTVADLFPAAVAPV